MSTRRWMGSSTLVGSTTRAGAGRESASRTMCAPLPFPRGGAGGGGWDDFSGFGFLGLLMGKNLFAARHGQSMAAGAAEEKQFHADSGGGGAS